MKRNPLKTICLSLVLMLLVVSMVPTFAEDLKGAYVVSYLGGTGLRLNVHRTPGILEVNDHIEEGTVVQYLHSEDGWAYVEWWNGNNDHRFGYVDPYYLTSITSNAGAVFKTVCGVYVHSTSKIQQGECAKYHTGDKLMKGQSVTVIGQDGTWTKVNFGGGYGWIPSIYLEKVG